MPSKTYPHVVYSPSNVFELNVKPITTPDTIEIFYAKTEFTLHCVSSKII